MLQQQDGDAAIRATDSDASLARLSAVNKGYLKDNYIQHFVPRARFQPPRPPLINIGTYIRSEGIDKLVNAWIKICDAAQTSYQIISLGAGSDTRFWRLSNKPSKDKLAKYVELDFPEITTKKAMAIKKNKDLSQALGDEVALGHGGTSLYSGVYHLLPVDLREDPSQSLPNLLCSPENPTGRAIMDNRLPTLLIFECVLAYMQPSASSTLLSWFAETFRNNAPLGILVYEMFGLNDSFGQVMKANLKTRGVDLPGVEPYSTLSTLPRRFTELNFALSTAISLKDIKLSKVPNQELLRIMNIERLDEVEELDLVLDHYAISWGISIPDQYSLDQWSAWDIKWDD